MKITSKSDIFKNLKFYIEEIKKGKVFIYPVDTIYGIGTNALLDSSIKKINNIKNRENNPYLIIAPNIAWIKDNTFFSNKQIEIIQDKLPGAYSFILELKNKQAISPLSNNNLDTVGIRIPNCWFSQLIEIANIPFVSTSVNLSWQQSAKSIDEIPDEILKKVGYIIKDDDIVSGNPSTIFDFSGDEIIKLRG